MKRISRWKLLFFPLLFALSATTAQNVAINTSGSAANASAILDLNTGNAGNVGFLAPQAALVSITDVATIPAPATGLIVYNTNAAMTNGSGTGYYFWNGTDWIFFSQGSVSSAWQILGNANIVDGTNFFGTTNNVPINFQINGSKAGRIDAIKNNTFIGVLSGNLITSATTGNENAGFGSGALQKVTSNQLNTAIGFNALNNTNDFGNTGLGAQALYSTNGGSQNTGVGLSAGFHNTTGGSNTAIGTQAMQTNIGGSNNTAVGYQALNLTNASYNTAVGYNALQTNSGGTYNTAIGYQADVSAAGFTNATAIGNGAIAGQSNALILGNASAQTGIQTNTPARALEIGGTANTARIDGLGSTGTIYNQPSATNVGNLVYANNANGDLWSIPAPSAASTLVSSATGVLSWQNGVVPTGTGTLDYLARWTPNGTTLGIGIAQDNGARVSVQTGVSAFPVGNIFTATANATDVTAILGTTAQATGYGVYGTNTAASGTAIYGKNNSTAGGTAAIVGQSQATAGQAVGVIGYLGALGNTATPTGVYGYTATANTEGVYGNNTSTTGQGAGVYGTTANTTAGSAAIYGSNSSTTISSVGVMGSLGTLVNTVTPAAIYGSVNSSNAGLGIVGAIYGSGPNSVGAYGYNASTGTGTQIGTYGAAIGASTTNVGGYFLGTGATNNYGVLVPSGGGNSGFGTITPTTMVQVGNSTTTTGKLSVYSQDNQFGQIQIGNPSANSEASMQFISNVSAFGSAAASASGNNYSWNIGAGTYGAGGQKFIISNLGVGPIMTFVSPTGYVGIGNASPSQNLSIQNGENIDMANLNNGFLNNGFATGNGLTFGLASGEGIASKRTGGGNQFGLDFYTNFTNKMSITNGGYVGIGTTTPAQALEIAQTNSTLRIDGIKTGNTYYSTTTAPTAASSVMFTNNTTGDVQALAPSATNGQVLTQTATGMAWQAMGALNNVSVLTGSGTFTPAAGTKSLLVEMVGGGGGGGGAKSNGSNNCSALAGGGGAGGYCKGWIATVAVSYAYSVGAGGTAGTNTPTNGGTGGTTTFGTFSATGGSGGTDATSNTNAANGGAGGIGTGGFLNLTGNTGGVGTSYSGNAGAGGATIFGGVGPFVTSVPNNATGNTPAANTGSGGGGAEADYCNTFNTQSAAGGAGAAGTIIVYEYK